MSANRRRLITLLGGVAVVAGALGFSFLRPVSKPVTRTASHVSKQHNEVTTTTVAPGELPQTRTFPSASGPLFIEKMQELVHAAAINRPLLAMPAFFPLAAYVQVKAITDPRHDWHTRLIANYESDIELVHEQLGPNAGAAEFVSADVPSENAVWVLPGTEYNNGSYWRVYDTTVYYREHQTVDHFTISSMISWRGEWYVVHLGQIR